MAALYKIDAGTINELSQIISAFFDYLMWLCQKRDFEAIEKLKPIIERIINLLQAIFGRNLPEMESIIDVLNRVSDEISESLSEAKKGEKVGALSEEVQKAWADFEAELAKLRS